MAVLPLPTSEQLFPAGGQLVRGLNALNDYAVNRSAAQYAPYTNYANAASKLAYANMLPYQIQATVMSNPMLWMAFKDNPEALRGMMQNFASSVPQGGNVLGNVQVPQPGTSNSLLGSLLAKLGIVQGPSSNAMQQMVPQQQGGMNALGNAMPSSGPMPSSQMGGQQSGSPLAPAAQGGFEGLFAKQLAPNVQSPYKPGTLIPDPNDPSKLISVPTVGTTGLTQAQLLAEKRVEPQLDRLAKEFEPFLSYKGKGQLAMDRLLSPAGLSSGELASKYAKAQSTLQTAPEALVKAFGLRPTNETLARLEHAVKPIFGETAEGYKTRMKGLLNDLRTEQVTASEQALGGGFNIPNQPASQGNAPDLSQMKTIRNKRTGEVITVPIHEARLKYGVQ